MGCGAQPGARNPMWRGGRSLASNGYVLIRVGVDHPLGDVRGYAYEHRLIAMAKLGRMLKATDTIHHRDGNKENNSWENIEVFPSRHHHARAHHPNARTRAPGEANRAISCACGCRRRFLKFDASGRPRRFISGHNGGRS